MGTAGGLSQSERFEEWKRENDSTWRPGPPTDKRCARCGGWLPVELFPVIAARSKSASWRKWKLGSYCLECKREATRRWREANRERVNERRRAEYAAALGSLPRCSECGVELESHARVVCSRKCKDARYRRLHPVEYREKRRRKDARRRPRARGES